jgi:glycosyltransferase involved in cell wall biosynthesis
MQEYADKRPDIVNIINKPNGHYGSCINAALKIATGKYFRILDADDWFDTDGLIELLGELRKADADIAVSAYKKHRKTRSISYKAKGVNFNIIYNIKNESFWKKQDFELFVMHSMTFKTSVLRDAKLKLTEGICYTDNEFLIYPVSKARTMVFFDIMLYNYDMTREGQSMDPKIQAQNHRDLAVIINRFLPIVHSLNVFSQKFCERVILSYYYRMLFCFKADEELKRIDCAIRGTKKDLLNNVSKQLLYTPVLWRFFGMHFIFYEKAKRLLKIDR